VMSVEGKELVFVPYFDVQLESYNTYFRKAWSCWDAKSCFRI